MTLLMRDRENQKIGEEIGKEIGKKIGKEIGRIFGAISMGKDLGLSDEELIARLRSKFDLTEEQARGYLEETE